MRALIIASLFLTSYTIFYIFFSAVMKKRQAVKIRLEKIAKHNVNKINTEFEQPLFVRVVRPILNDISRSILKIAPSEIKSSFDKKVIMAGNPFGLSINDWINLQLIMIIFIPLLTIILGYYFEVPAKTIFFISIFEIGVSLFLPNFLLNKKKNERQTNILKSLPNVLDLLTVSVEAGLSFDGALSRVIDKLPGDLAYEFEIVLQEIKVGKQRKDALKDMAERVGVDDISTFIGSIIQAEQLGVKIGNVLRIQADQTREKRKQRAQEKAMKAPVKMIIPMVLFILPALFAVLMGPVVIKLMDTFLNKL